MKRMIMSAILTISTGPAYAESYNYLCKHEGKSLPLKVNDIQNTLEWKGVIYKIKKNEDCAKFGWRAETTNHSLDFCTATKSYASIKQNGIEIPCHENRRRMF